MKLRPLSATASASAAPGGCCRLCGAGLQRSLVDLGMSPLCESFLPADQLDAMEPYYPLHVFVCESCFLVQLQEYVSPEHIFTEYAYFSSYSTSWVEHAETYCEHDHRPAAARAERAWPSSSPAMTATCCSISCRSACRCSGIEPAANVAQAAIDKGIPTRVRFLRRRSGAATDRRRHAGRSHHRQQRAGAGSRSQRLRGRHEGTAEARRCDHAGIPASASG